MAALDLPQTDVHRLLVEGRFRAHPPAQVDGLEAAAVTVAKVAEARENGLVEIVALRLQVLEGGAHEDAKRSVCLHRKQPLC
jgi:hypothetical protein